MSYKILKTIDMDLTKSSINRAIREIENFRKQLRDSMAELVEKLTNEGVEIAKMQVASLDAVYTGELEGSIDGYFIPGWGVGFISAHAPYAIFVEYGTGIIGESSPHPGINDPDWNDPVASRQMTGNGEDYWKYDSHKHGANGWFYRNDNDGKVHWTQGFVARPFMYHTLKWLEEVAPERASELWSQM